MRITMAKALNAGLRRSLAEDRKVVLAGEDIGRLGGVFRITEGLQEEFGKHRVIDSPLAESGIVGTAIGLAMRGYRPVVEMQFDGFVFPAFSQIVTQLARMCARTGGRVPMPVVVRIPYGGGIGAIEHHSESPEAYFAHTPGLHVVTPSTPADAYTMTRRAIACDDPVILLEPKRLYQSKGEVNLDDDGPDLFAATTPRRGRDITLIGYGPTVSTCLDAARVAADEGIEAEVVDLRSLSPVDWPTVFDSVRRTRRAVVVHEAQRALGMGAEIVARLHEELFYVMESPALRVAGADVPYPPARVERDYLPDVDRVLDAVDHAMSH